MFENGTHWIRADFHLHTRKDKEFKYSGDEDRFISDYIDKLKEEKIGLGVITNHNKFDLGEFKALKKKANKSDIILLPGVELSVKEGSNGIHCLIVFKDTDWINGQRESINQFLDEVFKNIDNRENENTRCAQDLPQVMSTLNSYGKDYFILMAHIEQKSGFYEECNGGLINSLANNSDFKARILGLQKGRTRDKMQQLKDWMGYELPYIEGSDCKSISDIGKGKHSYIKIGDNCFDSVMIAFKDFKNRISSTKPEIVHGYIQSIEFIGGKLNKQKINLSAELNCLIGIRGSGKSSIIEAIRYALDMSPSSSDSDYKKDVVENLLGSGGQIILKLYDNFGKSYKIKRILGEQPHVADTNDQVIGAKASSILKSPLYFGQKDLSSMDNGFELNLLDKMVGEALPSLHTKTLAVENEISDKIKELIALEDKIDSVTDLSNTLSDIEYKIKMFEEKGLSDKLSKQVNFQKDKLTIDKINKFIEKYKLALKEITSSDNISELILLESIDSKEIPAIFSALKIEIKNVTTTLKDIEKIITIVENSQNEIESLSSKFNLTVASLEEEFAEIKREINIPNLNPDEFSNLKIRQAELIESIQKITSHNSEKDILTTEIKALISQRNDALLEELDIYKNEIAKINASQDSLQLAISFKGNKTTFLANLKASLKGTGVTTSGYNQLLEALPDFTALVIDVFLDEGKIISSVLPESQVVKVKQKVRENYNSFLKIRTPNLITINYHGKPITKHSIGQRASALVLFILSQKDNNLIMIDQPEDDLDNQVIYNEIIKEIKLRKPDVQFIFATHNANIPVLGDSEQVIAVSYDPEKIETTTGSIDDKLIQNKIVDIMEGGQEAFNKRTEIYNLWKN